jgi:hypothetical protein
MGVIEAIKRGFGIATKSMGLVLVLIVFNMIWSFASLPFVGPAGAAKPELALAAVIFSVLFILISILVQGGSMALVRDLVKEGKMVLGGFLKYGLKYYLRLLGLGILIVLIISIVGLIAALIVIATAPMNNTIVTVIATLVAIVIGAIGLYIVLLLIMSPYIIVCDEAGIIESMKKSMTAVRKSIGKVLLLLIALILIAMGLGFLIGLLTGLVTVMIPAKAGQIVISAVNSIFNGYLGVVMMGSFLSFYLGLAEKVKGSAQKAF